MAADNSENTRTLVGATARLSVNECARCHSDKTRTDYSVAQWDQGAHRICEACLLGKACARCRAPKARGEYEDAQWAQGKNRVCKDCLQTQDRCADPRNMKSAQEGYDVASAPPKAQAKVTIVEPELLARLRKDEAEDPAEGLAAGVARQTRGVRKASVVSQHASSDFVEQHYEVLRELGKGAFGRVKLVRNRKTGHDRVCKLVSTGDMEPKLLELMRAEVELLCDLDHPCVSKIFEYAMDSANQELVIVLEYLRGGDCFSLLEKANGRPLREELVGSIVHQMLTALCYCHSQGVVHRDVKPENVMMVEKVKWDALYADCKLIDFGVAAHREAPKRGLYGTAPYMSPDVAVFAVKKVAHQVKDYTPKADVWSLGVTVFELLMDEGPFHCGGDRQATFRSLLTYSHFGELEKKFGKLPVFKQRSAEALSFVASLLVADPAKRPNSAEAMEHPWIRQHRCKRESLGDEMLQSLAGYQDAPPVVRCCLYVIASRLDVPDLERFGATFLRIDTDGDGKIGREELAKTLGEMEAGGGDTIDVDAILDAADLDHSGGINFTEFVAVCLYARHASLENLMQKSFEALDDDRDGLITLDQVRLLFRERDAKTFQWLPQDRPFGIDEWFNCVRTVRASQARPSTAVRSRLLALDVPVVPPQLQSRIEALDFSKISMRTGTTASGQSM